MSLLKENRPEHDFFLADIFDNTSFKDDMASMENPMFVLSKKKDMRCLEYRNNNITVSIIPSVLGLPNIFDKDILLYCGSLLMKEVNAGRIPSKSLRISSHDLLVSTNRRTDGIAYTRLKSALDRLRGVSIKTNIKTNRREQTNSFGMIDSYNIVESSKVKNRMIRLEITLSEWFYNSILGKEVLTINRDYFRLGKPLERRLYELARKHCGRQNQWAIGLIPLMGKTGSRSTLRLFRSRLKEVARDDHLPDYSLSIDSSDKVTFFSRQPVEELPLFDELPRLRHDTISRAKEIVEGAGTGWDFYALHEQFTQSLIVGKFTPNNADGAFINFIKKKVLEAP